MMSGFKVSSMYAHRHLVLVLALVVTAAACSSEDESAAPVTSRPESVTTTQSGPPSCNPDHLTAAVAIAPDNQAERALGTVRVTNNEANPCFVDGFPKLELNQGSATVAADAKEGGGFLIPEQEAAKVVLPPGESVYFDVEYSGAATAPNNCRSIDLGFIRYGAPSESAPLGPVIYFQPMSEVAQFRPCGPIVVSAFRTEQTGGSPDGTSTTTTNP